MKIKAVILASCVGLFSSVFAANDLVSSVGNRHVHPKAVTALQADTKKVMLPGFCEIEIINNSAENVVVYGQFDDGSELMPFNIYRFEYPHYISLYYYNYCHEGMMLTINTFSGYPIYSGYTPVHSTFHVVSYLNNQVKAEISKK